MNDQVKAPATEPTTVQMDDGRIVEFASKRRILKTAIVDGSEVRLRLDYVNGETRLYTLPASLVLRAAAHGMSQVYGDKAAGVKDLDDAILAIDELHDRIAKGEWSAERAPGDSTSGGSTLLKALVEVTGKPAATVRDFLAGITQAQKMALRTMDPTVAPVVKRIESERAAAKPKASVDTGALLAGLV